MMANNKPTSCLASTKIVLNGGFSNACACHLKIRDAEVRFCETNGCQRKERIIRQILTRSASRSECANRDRVF